MKKKKLLSKMLRLHLSKRKIQRTKMKRSDLAVKLNLTARNIPEFKSKVKKATSCWTAKVKSSTCT